MSPRLHALAADRARLLDLAQREPDPIRRIDLIGAADLLAIDLDRLAAAEGVDPRLVGIAS